jgi:predicted nucleic acid-binding Zn ribbon protein
MTARKNDGPRRLGESMPRLLNRLGAPPSTATMESVFSRWDELVGTELSAHARPVRIDGRTLVVAVDHPAWGTRVRMDAGRILGRVTMPEGRSLERIEVVVERP